MFAILHKTFNAQEIVSAYVYMIYFVLYYYLI